MNHIVHIACTDAKGLVANITSTLFKHGVNIEEMREYVDRQLSNFFMRLELSGEINHDSIKQELFSLLPLNAKVKISLKQPKDLIVLATKEYHCLSELLLKHHFGELNANIKCVIANHENLRDLTSKFGIPFFFVDHQHKSKDIFENEIMEIVKAHSPDYLVLAKFMRILTPEFVSHYPDSILNIHHSFLPAFVGANPYKQAFERGVKMIGATAHFVNNNLDEGPIITQKIVPIDHSYTVEAMVSAGHDVERQTLIDALKLVVDDRVFVEGNKTIVFS